MDKLLTTRQAASILQVNIEQVYRYIADGRLKAHKLGGNGHNQHKHWRIQEKDLQSFAIGEGKGAETTDTEANINYANSACQTQHPADFKKES